MIYRLWQAIPKLHFNDVEAIVNGLLLSLTAYKTRSRHGPILLETLLNKVSTSLRTGVRSADDTLLRTTRLYLDLIAFVVVERRTAPAVQLLRFYCSHLSSKITLQKFSPEDQILVICNMVETFDAASKAIEPSDDGPQLDVLRKQVMDASPFLLEVRAGAPSRPLNTIQPMLVPWKDVNRPEIGQGIYCAITVMQRCKWSIDLLTSL
jgi:hypothetical protein